MKSSYYQFSTNRLLIKEWHSLESYEWNQEALPEVVKRILSPTVTQSLPPMWQGDYTIERASKWIQQQDSECITLLIVDKSTKNTIGFIILFEDDKNSILRLGYLLCEQEWGKGYATELIAGFTKWCEKQKIPSVIAGVNKDNTASIYVLKKNGFTQLSDTSLHDELSFILIQNK